MAILDERLAKLEQRHAEDRARLIREGEILSLVPESLQGFDLMAHPHKLYDRIGSLHVRSNRYESLRKSPNPTPADVLRFLDAFPPMPLAVYRDSFVGFRTLEDAQKKLAQDEEKNPDTTSTYSPIAPFHLTFESASYSQETTIHWISRTPIGPLQVSISFPMFGSLAPIGRVEIRRSGKTQGEYGLTPIISAVLAVSDSCRVIGDSKACIGNRGLSEDRTQPGSRELYYDSCNGECSTTTIADLFKAAGITA